MESKKVEIVEKIEPSTTNHKPLTQRMQTLHAPNTGAGEALFFILLAA